MTAPLLTVAGVGKSFRRYPSERDRIFGWFGLPAQKPEDRWVLRDIGFAVHPGEALGIVGRNGAGKSTLLKMIAGIMRPTEGAVSLSGRVAAILELGMGFNGEATGRRNAFHAAGMMGFSRAEIDAAMPGIADFAELGAYFDQPLRIYSSGMQMRLAFAVATAFRPDILIVDEALAVGDTYFQHKSMERIRSFQEAGTSLILVSHDRLALQSLCTRAMLLDEGRLVQDGSPDSVLDYYNALMAHREGEQIITEAADDGRIRTISGTRDAVIEDIRLLDAKGQPADTFGTGREMTLQFSARAMRDLPVLVAGYAIRDRLGQTLFGTNTGLLGKALDDVAEGETCAFRFTFPVLLGPGTYSLTLALTGGDSHLEASYEWRDRAALFTVVNLDQPPFDGLLFIPPQAEIVRSRADGPHNASAARETALRSS